MLGTIASIAVVNPKEKDLESGSDLSDSDDDEDESDGEYVPTDPGEFSSKFEEDAYARERRAARHEDYYSLETKQEGKHYSELDTKMKNAEARTSANNLARTRGISYPFSPPEGHRENTKAAAQMRRQPTPQ